MASQNEDIGTEKTIYDTVIIGGGIAGLTAGYMLRDKNLLLLEQEDRFGGRVCSEKVGQVTNNIGTQFFTEEDTSFVHLIDELDIKRVTHNPASLPMALYLNNELYSDVSSLLSPRVIFDAIRFLSRIYRKQKIFQLPIDDPSFRKLAAKDGTEFQKGYSPAFMSLVNGYMRGACVSKPERTSAVMWAHLAQDVYKTGDMAFVTGGFQKITDGLVEKLEGRVMSGAMVSRVEETDGIVTTCFLKDGKEHIIKSKSAVVAVPSPLVSKLIPALPDWKKEALEKVMYGPLIILSVFLKRDIPWENRPALVLADNLNFQGVIDTTVIAGDDTSGDNPLIYNFTIAVPPDEKEEIEALLGKSDEEIVKLMLNDFKTMMPEVDIDNYITGTKVTRYPIGELELSPEYFLELLPELLKPVGNIHFCGDYTETKSFVDGAAYSGMRVARALGSQNVVSEAEEIKFPKDPKWGLSGWLTMICNILLIVCGFFLPPGYGMTMGIGAGALMALTVVYPSFFPPFKLVYKVLLGLTIGFGGIVGLLSVLIG